MSRVQATGQGLSGGLVTGKASLVQDVKGAAPDVSAIFTAAQRRYQQYADDQALSIEAREVALVYLSLIEDPSLLESVRGKVQAGISVRQAVLAACSELRASFERSNNAYIRERGHDLIHLAKDLLGPSKEIEYAAIWLVSNLTPTLLFLAKEQGAQGLVCAYRLPASGHLAILARSLGLVVVAGVADIDTFEGLVISVDGKTGAIYTGPASEQAPVDVCDYNDLPLWINISSSSEINSTKAFRGIGLFRTEFIYLRRNSIPSRDTELEEYKDALMAALGKPVIFRLLDFGADKPLPGRPTKLEPNPMLGTRGVRLLLEEPDLLKRQLELLIAASPYGDLRIMVPMVTDVREMCAIRSLLNSLGGAHIPLGAMVETPAAALLTKELCQVSDFLSLGTNDLSAYVYASDRMGLGVSTLGKAEALMRLIKMVADQAIACNKPLGVCGEMAADPVLARQLMEIGCSYLSVPAQELKFVAAALKPKGGGE